MKGPVELGALDLAVASGLVFLAGLISFLMRLGVTRSLAIAAVRTVVQLLLLGLVLEWVFSLDRPLVVLAVIASMLINAGLAAVRNAPGTFPGVRFVGLAAVTVSGVLVTVVVTEVVIGVEPWYAPRYLIPLMGMVLGNSLTGISLALGRMMQDLRARRDEVEGWLALGATVWEATQPIVADAVRTGMVPIINAMTVAGIVSLPGMMTGQILAGQPPFHAVMYQVVVMFMVAAGATTGSLVSAYLCFRRLSTSRHQLRFDDVVLR